MIKGSKLRDFDRKGQNFWSHRGWSGRTGSAGPGKATSPQLQETNSTWRLKICKANMFENLSQCCRSEIQYDTF